MWSWPGEQTLSTAWGGMGGGYFAQPNRTAPGVLASPLRASALGEERPLFHKKARTQPLPMEMWPLQPRQGSSLGWGECGTGRLEPGRPVAVSPEQVRKWAVST